MSENTHQNAESCPLDPEKWHPRKQSLLECSLVRGLGKKHGLFPASEGVFSVLMEKIELYSNKAAEITEVFVLGEG